MSVSPANVVLVTDAMLDAGEQAMADYWTEERMALSKEGDGSSAHHARLQLRDAYLAMRRLEIGGLAEGSK